MLLLGDWAPGKRSVYAQLEHVEDVVLFNLEGPLLTGQVREPIKKAGPAIYNASLPRASRAFAALANNHLMDFGESGFLSTCDNLVKHGILYCGAGIDSDSARKPVVINEHGLKIGIISCCEAQFGVARNNQAGVAEFGGWVYQSICNLKKQADHVVVSVHAGNEMSPWPSPFIQDLYRSYIDAGASVVHGHHSHVPQGYEEYQGGLIIYGLGNFAVDTALWKHIPNALWSIGVEIDFMHFPSWRLKTFDIERAKDGQISVEEKPLDAAKEHYLASCNQPLQDRCLLDGVWQDVAMRLFNEYGAMYMRFYAEESKGRRFTIRKGLRLCCQALSRNKMKQPQQSDYLLWYHMFACESHRQMMQTALGILGGEISDMRTEETRQLADEMMPWSCGMVSK